MCPADPNPSDLRLKPRHELDQLTQRTLDWEGLKRRLAERCTSALGRLLVETLAPTLDSSTLEHRHILIRELQALLEAQPSLHSLVEAEGSAQKTWNRARKGAVLEPEEIRLAAQHMMSVHGISSVLRENQSVAPCWHSLWSEAPIQSPLVARIQHSIGPDHTILDSASTTLRDLRRQKQAKRAQMQRQLEKRVSQWHQEGILQDEYFDAIEGRFVVPIKSSQMGVIPGNVYSRSQSRHSFYLEPNEFIAENNALQEIENGIRAEEYRILKELSEQLGGVALQYQPWESELALFDFVAASCRLAKDYQLALPVLSGQQKLEFHGLFHPFLLDRGKVPVRNHLHLAEGDQGQLILISGPNTGGKTVLLKAAALCLFMHQSGLPSACSETSILGFVSGIFVLVGDEQDLNQGLSSFSSQIMELQALLQNAPRGSFICIDEILASTDPDEASALALSFLGELLKQSHFILCTSHFSSLAKSASQLPGGRVGAMAFEEARPTYQFLPGIIGSSHALDVAESLGVDAALLERARQGLPQARQHYERELKALEQQRLESDREKVILQEAHQRHILELERKHQQDLSILRDQYDRFLLRADEIVEKEVRSQVSRLRIATGKAPAVKIHGGPLKSDLEKAAKEESTPHQARPTSLSSTTPLQKGDRVSFSGWGGKPHQGTILEWNERKQEALVFSGIGKMWKPFLELKLVSRPRPDQTKVKVRLEAPSSAASSPGQEAATLTLDLRGQRRDAAVSAASAFLERSLRLRTPWIRIITGHGTGALKMAIQELLKETPFVKKVQSDREGDDGALSIELDIPDGIL